MLTTEVSMDTLCLEIDVDPVQISVNRHFKNRSAVPPGVRLGMDQVVKETRNQIESQGFTVGETDLLSMTFDFYFRTWSGDIDNPIKRSIDAIMEGINQPGIARVDDKRIVDLHVRKRIAARDQNPRIAVCIKLMDGESVETPKGYKKPRSAAAWVG